MKLIELFGGIGACTKAFKNIGMNVDVVDYVEIDKYAVKSYNAINGTNFEPQDIKEWDKDINVDIIMHGSPCFLAGERVNTKGGFKNIENIKIGDYVKSHNGEYNKVIEIMKNKNNYIFDVSCSATHNINTTFNHPFFILRNNKKEWIEAQDLTTKDFMCIPINNQENEIEYTTNLPITSIRFWYLIGRFIGDGWVTRRKERNNNISGIKICCAKNELDDLKSKLCNILNYCVIEDKTTYKLQFLNKELGEFCEQFGIGAKNKHIPQWVLDLKKEYLKYLLMGIVDSDGCYSQNKYKVTTISRDLAYNIGELVLKTKGVPYHIYKTIRPKKYKIENRIVNQNNTYQITWGYKYNKNINFVDENYLYSRIRKINKRNEDNYVYNIEVENMHSYCVNNIAVHNCQDFSVAGKQAGGDLGSGTRSSLLYETIRIVGKLRPKYVIWENVKNLLSKKHKHNFDNYIETMNILGYNSYYQVLNAKDYGIPQNRERVYTISIRKDIDNGNFKFPEKEELKLRLKDMLEDEVDEKYYLKKTNNLVFTETRASWDNSGKGYGSQQDRAYYQDGLCPTLSNCNASGDKSQVVLTDKTICLNSKGGRNGVEGLQPSLKDRIYDSNGIATCCATSNFFMLNYTDENGKPRKDIKELDKYCEYCGNKLERKRFNGRLEDFTVFSNRKYCNRECMKRDFLKIGEHDQSYSNAHTTARKINELILHKEVCELCGNDTNLDIHHIDGNWQNNNLDNLMCLCRSCHTKYERNKDKTELRIRKLTPREVWRLMGFSDEDFEKAKAIPMSNTQLYKQAGNSIVVNVLEKIFLNLFN